MRLHLLEAEEAVEKVDTINSAAPAPLQGFVKNAHLAALIKLSHAETSSPWVDDWLRKIENTLVPDNYLLAITKVLLPNNLYRNLIFV